MPMQQLVDNVGVGVYMCMSGTVSVNVHVIRNVYPPPSPLYPAASCSILTTRRARSID